MSDNPRTENLRQYIHQQIPLTRAMGFEWIDYDGRNLAFELSLDPNRNDKGTAFAGALSASANLCGWGAVTLLLEDETQSYDVVIRDSRLEYLLPVTRDFRVQALMPDEETVKDFLHRLRERGKARCDVEVVVQEQGRVCFRMSASYVALLKKQWL